MQDITVVRNEKSLVFKQEEVKRGKNKGWKFMNPEVTEQNLSEVINWAGGKESLQIIKGALRQRAMGWSEEAEEEAQNKDTKVLDEPKYIDIFSEMAKNYSARGESIPQLKEQIEELLGDFVAVADVNEKMRIAEEIKALQIAINSKKRQPKEEEEGAAKAA